MCFFLVYFLAKAPRSGAAWTQTHKSSWATWTRGVTQGSVVILTVHVGLRLHTAKVQGTFSERQHTETSWSEREREKKINEANANRQASRHQSVSSRRDRSRAIGRGEAPPMRRVGWGLRNGVAVPAFRHQSPVSPDLDEETSTNSCWFIHKSSKFPLHCCRRRRRRKNEGKTLVNNLVQLSWNQVTYPSFSYFLITFLILLVASPPPPQPFIVLFLLNRGSPILKNNKCKRKALEY